MSRRGRRRLEAVDLEILERVIELFLRTDQDDDEIDDPLSGADFVDEVGQALRDAGLIVE